jgi:hypothetical protein
MQSYKCTVYVARTIQLREQMTLIYRMPLTAGHLLLFSCLLMPVYTALILGLSVSETIYCTVHLCVLFVGDMYN